MAREAISAAASALAHNQPVRGTPTRAGSEGGDVGRLLRPRPGEAR
jgi:hypothetical protein